MHDGELGLAAPAGDAHHPVALAEAMCLRTDRGDLAGQLQSRDVLGRVRRGRIVAGALHHVGAVETGRPHADEDLAGPRLGIGMVLDAQLLDRGW